MKEKKNNYGFYFLGGVILLYILLALVDPEHVLQSLKTTGKVLIRVAPIILLVIGLMGIAHYLLRPQSVSRYLGKDSGMKGYLIAVSTGILSHGPIYIWYALLKELRDRGMSEGLIAVFLYNRAIKLPLLPLLIHYFGISFAVILLVYMVLASLLQGEIMTRWAVLSRRD
jgi:uncharacterized membrane protein YraQ (UPF0718 family)